MKKISLVLFSMILFFSLSVCRASADQEAPSAVQAEQTGAALPSIDEALQNMTAESGKVEVSDDLSEYDPDQIGEFDFGDYRFLILERRCPEMEFTEYDSGYPDDYKESFPDDFTGVRVGESRVWLRCDLMNKLPDYLRAPSLAEADVLIIAEDQYYWASTISVTDYIKSSDAEMPEFETVEEMMDYLASHQPVIDKITYYPMFSAYALVDLYSPVTKECELYDYSYSPRKVLARNPDAAMKWNELEAVAGIISDLSSDHPDAEAIKTQLSGLESAVPEDKLAFWTTCAGSGEYPALVQSMDDYFWENVNELVKMDSDEVHQANYELILEQKDYRALAGFVAYCDYSGFDTPVSFIKSSKQYLAKPDYDWLEDSLNELVDLIASMGA